MGYSVLSASTRFRTESFEVERSNMMMLVLLPALGLRVGITSPALRSDASAGSTAGDLGTGFIIARNSSASRSIMMWFVR